MVARSINRCPMGCGCGLPEPVERLYSRLLTGKHGMARDQTLAALGAWAAGNTADDYFAVIPSRSRGRHRLHFA